MHLVWVPNFRLHLTLLKGSVATHKMIRPKRPRYYCKVLKAHMPWPYLFFKNHTHKEKKHTHTHTQKFKIDKHECLGFDLLMIWMFCSCSPCNCDPAGSETDVCNANTGFCTCKQFVEGEKCSRCIQGTSGLSASNPFGCSKGTVLFCPAWRILVI